MHIISTMYNNEHSIIEHFTIDVALLSGLVALSPPSNCTTRPPATLASQSFFLAITPRTS